jgi:selenocysteine-specific elongation factor
LLVSRPIFGATALDVAPPRLRGTGSAAAAGRELASWPDAPKAVNLLRRHRLVRASAASAMGLRDLPAPVAGEWLADPEHWRQLRQRLAAVVAAQLARDPLAQGLSLDAARAELGLPDRALVEALAALPADDRHGAEFDLRGGYLRTAGGTDRAPDEAESSPGPGRGPSAAAAASRSSLPGPVARAVQALLEDLAKAPFSAPDSDRLRELGLDTRAAAAAERAGLLRRLPGNVVLATDAPGQAAAILARLPQPFTAAEARQALRSTRRVVIPLLEWLDREGITRRLPDDRRVMRGSQPRSDGGR